jgi:hypothetical protein
MVKLNKKISFLLGVLFTIASLVVVIIVTFFYLASPSVRIENDIKRNILQSDVLRSEKMLYAKDSSAGWHYSQLDSSFQISEQHASLLLKQGPFKPCTGACKSTTWSRLDVGRDNVVYPITEIRNLADQSKVYCANQTSSNGNEIHTTRDICLDTKTNQVWYMVYLP